MTPRLEPMVVPTAISCESTEMKWRAAVTADKIWRYYKHPVTDQIQRIHHTHKGHIDVLLKYGWVEVEWSAVERKDG